MAEAPQEGSKLSDLFEEIWKIFIFVDTCDEPLADDKVQVIRIACCTAMYT